MGGDSAPLEAVRGGVQYARETGTKVLLVGREPDVSRALSSVGSAGALVEVVPAADVIDPRDKIALIRNKRNSSMHRGTRLVRDGDACAFVSAGHTGALMFISKVVYGVLEGVERPALPAPLPRLTGGYGVLLDAGANVDCRPEHFRQFAVMGCHYSRRIFGVENPRVGLLSIGEEDSKGTEILREVSRILKEAHINFIGNVEGTCLFRDGVDVVVCDGFVGNVTLKVAEGLAETIGDWLRREMTSHPVRALGALPLRRSFRDLKKKTDYAEYGGVPLLGLRHVSVVAHGRSSDKAIFNALRVGAAAAAGRLVEKIAEEIAVLHQAERRLAV